MDQVDESVTGQGTLVQVLGPVTATVRGRPCLISSPMQRAVLSLLAVDAGRVVSVDRLISELWESAPDRRPRPSRCTSPACGDRWGCSG